MGLRAKVQNGRLVLDEASELPEGTVLDLVIDDEGDDIDENERHALHEAIAKSVEQARRGDELEAELKRRSCSSAPDRRLAGPVACWSRLREARGRRQCAVPSIAAARLASDHSLDLSLGPS